MATGGPARNDLAVELRQRSAQSQPGAERRENDKNENERDGAHDPLGETTQKDPRRREARRVSAA
jgi:hypothetical protein